LNIDHKYLVLKLVELFGSFDEENKKFKKASNSAISRELGYSDAQFSRLINGHATEGEYVRANQNTDRILALKKYQSQEQNKSIGLPSKKVLWIALPLLLVLIILSYFIGASQTSETQIASQSRYDMLKWSFETEYVNPFIKLEDLPADCNFPCYKYQGKWELKNPYKLPFFREQSGFHYVATEVQMYARCMTEKSDSGNIIEGYEYQKHEIWYDKRELPIDSFLIQNDNSLRATYMEMDMNTKDNFVKLAYIHTFFRNEFELDSGVIKRKGKVIGRDVEFIDKARLIDQLQNIDLVDEVTNEVNKIIINRMEDFSRPIVCESAIPANDSFHDIIEGNIMSFDCRLTTSRVAMKYEKGYLLKDQYIKNKCRLN